MKILFKLLIFTFVFPSISISADTPSVAWPDTQKTISPSEDLVWNKWDTANFIVLSIDKSQGVYIKNNIEKFKLDFEKRWGLEKSNFSIPCKILCVPDDKLLGRFFNLDLPRTETRTDSDGSLSSAIWSDFNRFNYNYNQLVGAVCLEHSKNSILLKRGIPRLENSLDFLKSDFSEVIEVDVKSALNADREYWLSLKSDDRKKFDKNAALICLFLRREFGFAKFKKFISSDQSESSLRSIYGFDLDNFSKTLKRYSENLSNDIKNQKMPDKYLRMDQ